MKYKITSKQISYSAACLVIASSLITKQLSIFAKNEAWIPVLIGFLFSFFMIGIYSAIAGILPGQSLIEINDAVFGKAFGKVISLLHSFNFAMLVCLNGSVIVHFIGGFILPTTPLFFIMVLFFLIVAWAIRKGAVNLMRLSMLFVFIATAAILFNTVLLGSMMNVQNFLPVFSLKVQDYLMGAHFVSMIPFCETLIFFMFIPEMQKPETFGKALKRGLIFGAAVYLLVVVRDTAVLGAGSELFSFPTYSVLRFINVGDVLTRLEIIYVFILIMLVFFKVSVIFYAALTSFQRIMKFDSYKFLILIFAVLMIIYSVVMQNTSEQSLWLVSGAAPIYSSFFLILLPVITIITAAFRGLFIKRSGALNQKDSAVS